MTTGRDGAQLVTVNGRVIILGGTGDSTTLGTMEELDMGQKAWRRLGVRMKKPRMGFSAAVMERRYLCN